MRYFYAFLVCAAAFLAGVSACSDSGGSGTKGSTGTASGGANSGTTGTLSAAGGSGSMTTTGAFMTNTATSGTGCAAQLTCAGQGFNCGMTSDGCGGLLNCGTTCPNAGDTCGGGGMPNVCGQMACTPKTMCPAGDNCGAISDGCNGTLMCGPMAGACPTGQTCNANVCGTTTCVPITTCPAGDNCGSISDGCTGTVSCGGACPSGQICGGAGVQNQCGTPVCVPKTFAQACTTPGKNCGFVSDGCSNVIDCGMGQPPCNAPNVCGTNNICGPSATCTGLCLQQQTCPMAGVTTSVSGKVFAPNGTDPLYNTLVYVPNGGPAPTYGVTAISPGVHCGPCGDDVSGSPLVSAVTGIDGSFTLNNMPVGANIPIVIQNGRWRRKMTIPNVPACVNTALPMTGPSQLRMPRIEAETDPADNIPLMGFVTGSVDALECVLRKIGIADTAFSDANGSGRVQFYQGNGGPGAVYSGSTPPEDLLWGQQSQINKYDMVYFACQGNEYVKSAANQTILLNYANAGGRVFATHYSYVWLANNPPAAPAPWQGTATWNNPLDKLQNFTSDPETGFIDTTFPKGLALAQWLQGIGATTTQGQISIATLRDNFSGVNAPSLDWIYLKDKNYPGTGTVANPAPKPMHYTFNTPLNAMPANQCGKVLYDDFHVENQSFFVQPTFPAECTVAGMSPQEKMLEFMIFDLGSCVGPPPACVPKTCTQLGAQCGQIGDGCGGIDTCPQCPTGQFCVNNQCQGCVAKTCQQQGVQCGQTGDGCGGIAVCPMCPTGQTCINGVCQVGMCTPKSCATLGFTCGVQTDGCSGTQNCGGCAPASCNPSELAQSCINGSCVSNACTPKTCAQQGFNCGLASDGCNCTIDCGMCTNGQTCGGGVSPKPNVCGGGPM